MRVTKCCLFVDIWLGANILGCLAWFGLLAEFKSFNPVRLAFTLLTGVAYLNMVFDDSSHARKYFFFAYLAQVGFMIVFSIYLLMTGIATDEELTKACDNLEKHNFYKDFGWKDDDACKDYLTQEMRKYFIMITILALLLNWHFCLVLEQHWKNASTLSRIEGGLVDDVGGPGSR